MPLTSEEARAVFPLAWILPPDRTVEFVREVDAALAGHPGARGRTCAPGRGRSPATLLRAAVDAEKGAGARHLTKTMPATSWREVGHVWGSVRG